MATISPTGMGHERRSRCIMSTSLVPTWPCSRCSKDEYGDPESLLIQLFIAISPISLGRENERASYPRRCWAYPISDGLCVTENSQRESHPNTVGASLTGTVE